MLIVCCFPTMKILKMCVEYKQDLNSGPKNQFCNWNLCSKLCSVQLLSLFGYTQENTWFYPWEIYDAECTLYTFAINETVVTWAKVIVKGKQRLGFFMHTKYKWLSTEAVRKWDRGGLDGNGFKTCHINLCKDVEEVGSRICMEHVRKCIPTVKQFPRLIFSTHVRALQGRSGMLWALMSNVGHTSRQFCNTLYDIFNFSSHSRLFNLFVHTATNSSSLSENKY